ncbi:hypothetical protein ON010_g7410 [Phytophthora cinnamomi]|nr:hypothetical protein ON010_g7410 [Phytophthora cinnamomi]
MSAHRTKTSLSPQPLRRIQREKRRTEGHGVVEVIGGRVQVHDVRHAPRRRAELVHVVAGLSPLPPMERELGFTSSSSPVCPGAEDVSLRCEGAALRAEIVAAVLAFDLVPGAADHSVHEGVRPLAVSVALLRLLGTLVEHAAARLAHTLEVRAGHR